MRLRELDLLAFGPFTGTRLELGQVPGAVDIVYGPNEAGKSTALRAVSGLLFGIPEKTVDAHTHARGDLRIGGIIERPSGERLEFVRRKARKETLSDRSGKPLDDALLFEALRGISAEFFAAMFGLDHERLRSGAEAMLEGKGNVGESLFAAGAGATTIHRLRERLSREAEMLYTPRGRDKRLVVRAIADVRDARQRVDDLSVSAGGYLEQVRERERVLGDQAALRAKHAGYVKEQSKLQRVLQAKPDVSRRADILGKLAAHGDVVILPEDATSQRLAAVRKRHDVARNRERLAEDMERLVAARRDLTVKESLIAIDDAVIKDLDDRRSRYGPAQVDLPKRRAEYDALEAQLRLARRAFDPAGDAPKPTPVRLGPSQMAKVRRLVTDHAEVHGELGRLRRDLAREDSKRTQLAARLATSLGTGRVTAVRAAIERASELVVPSPETVVRRGGEQQKLAQQTEALAEAKARLEERRRDARQKIDALERAGAIPTEDELRAVRARRDALWGSLRAAAGPFDEATSKAFEDGVAAADDVSDRLRREADRVARLSALLSEERAHVERLAALDIETENLAAKVRHSDAAWVALFDGAGFRPLSPEEMRPWVARFGELLDVDATRARLAEEIRGAETRRAEWQRSWSESIESLGVSGGASPDEAMVVLDALSEYGRLVEQGESLQRRIDAMRRDSDEFVNVVAGLVGAHLPELGAFAPAEAAARFVRARDEAVAAEKERTRLGREIDERRARLAKLEIAERDADDEVAALLRAARVNDLDELEAVERKSVLERELRSELGRVETRLLELCEGASLDDLVHDAAAVDLDVERNRLDELRTAIDELTEELQRGAARLATIEAGVSRLERPEAADAANELSACVTRLKRHTRDYLRLKLASALLDREVERYRQENQGPLVSRAGELLPTLTLGRYAGLTVDFGSDDDEAALYAVRQDGARIPVEGLSDGARDQLYLALRLASIERYLLRNEPMPVVLDDILVHSDEDRTRAALGVLGELATKTQVLLFTHHAHVVDAARAVLGPTGVVEHVLARGEIHRDVMRPREPRRNGLDG